MNLKFKDLSIMDSFYFASELEWYSLGMAKGPWIKLSSRKYCHIDKRNMIHNVGSVHVEILKKGYK